MNNNLFFVFDVESIGLHGEGFAFGYVVVDESGHELESGLFSTHSNGAAGTADSHKWVKENIPPLEINCISTQMLRTIFWDIWQSWKADGAQLVTDCGWPVEANFLSGCVADYPDEREWEGPYPLLDVSSVLLAAGKNPVGSYPRLENELPAHNPLNDARQSARILIECLNDARNSRENNQLA